jgi:hypothetical protein
MAKSKRTDSLAWGLILIALGVILLFEMLDVRLWRIVWRFWPVILIVWGASKLYYGIKERNERLEKTVPPPGQEP